MLVPGDLGVYLAAIFALIKKSSFDYVTSSSTSESYRKNVKHHEVLENLVRL